MSLFKSNTTEDYYKQTPVNNVYRGGKEPRKPKTHKEKLKQQSEDNIIKDVRNLFKLKKENKAIKDRIIKDI